MYPVLFEFRGVVVTSFGVFMALAFFAAGAVFSRELRRLGEDADRAWDLVAWGAVSGLIGAKLYYLLLHWDDTLADPVGALLSRGGLVWYGGFLATLAVLTWKVGRAGLPVPRYADAAAPAAALAYAVGRVGCFLVGDDYGRPTDLPWGVAFPEGAPPSTAANLRAFGAAVPDSIPGGTVLAVHPTQLYEVGLSLLIFALLWRLRRRLVRPGALFAVWLACAGVERFLVEFFRAKDDRFLLGLTVAQLISVGLVVGGLVLARRLRNAPAGTQVAAAGAR